VTQFLEDLLPVEIAVPLHVTPAYDPRWEARSKAMRSFEMDSDRTEELRGGTALHQAAGGGHSSVVSFLLGMNASVETLDSLGGTPLHRAAAQGHTKVAELLLDAGADINRIYSPDVVLKMLMGLKYSWGTTNVPGGTALHQAVRNEKVEIVQLLLSKGADRGRGYEIRRTLKQDPAQADDQMDHDVKSEVGTPLALATKTGNVEIVKLLLASGASTDHEADSMEPPLIIALKRGYSSIAHLLLEHGANVLEGPTAFADHETAVHEAAKTGLVDILKTLLDKDVPVDFMARCNKSALEASASAGQAAATLFLVERGANLENYGQNAMLAAIKNRHEEVFQILLKKIDPLKFRKEWLADAISSSFEGKWSDMTFYPSSIYTTITSQRNYDPFNASSEVPYPKGIVELALSAGMDVNSEKWYGSTLLQEAIIGRHPHVVEFLISHGADVNHGDRHDRTPLYWAFWSNDEQTAILLLKNGANPNECDKHGVTLLQRAWRDKSEHGRLHSNQVDEAFKLIKKVLLEHGANPNTSG
jgi:ankyrin repeat protein